MSGHDDRAPTTAWVLGVAVIAMALVTGLIVTFAVAVMPNLADADDLTFVSTMQRYNDNPMFMLLFTAALAMAITALVMLRRDGPSAAARSSITALVLFGIVNVITAVIHFPLNDQITQAGDPNLITDLAALRDDVEGPWVVWNIVRALFSTAAVAALAAALFQHGRDTADTQPTANNGTPSWAPPTPTTVGHPLHDVVDGPRQWR